MNSYEPTFAAQVTKLGFLVRMVVCTTFIAPASAALAQSTSSDIWLDSKIDCEKSRWEITVEDPEGDPLPWTCPVAKLFFVAG